MSGTTSIESLPSDPSMSAGAPVQNVQMEITEKNVAFSQDTKPTDGNTGGMPSAVKQQFIEQTRQNFNKKDNLDVIYNELQVPILISLLFFLFNLPFFKKTLNNYAGFLFQKDGNYNLYGFTVTSTLFGLFFYIFKAILKHFSTF